MFLFCDTSKFVLIMNNDCHLYTLSQTESDDNNDTSSDESDLDVISTVDETENIAISIKNQTKLSINDVNTSNEIEGHVSDKRFCTVILTVFAEDNTRVGPVVLFKGKGQVSDKEQVQYASDVKVFFTPKAFNNRL